MRKSLHLKNNTRIVKTNLIVCILKDLLRATSDDK